MVIPPKEHLHAGWLTTDTNTDEFRIAEALPLNKPSPHEWRAMMTRAVGIADKLRDGSPDQQRKVLVALFPRINLDVDAMHINVNRSALAELLRGIVMGRLSNPKNHSASWSQCS